MNLAIVKNNKIIDILAAESLEIAEEAINITYGDVEIINTLDIDIEVGVNWIRVDNQWLPPEDIN